MPRVLYCSAWHRRQMFGKRLRHCVRLCISGSAPGPQQRLGYFMNQAPWLRDLSESCALVPENHE
jgi:hypothetical protein